LVTAYACSNAVTSNVISPLTGDLTFGHYLCSHARHILILFYVYSGICLFDLEVTASLAHVRNLRSSA